MTCDRCTHLERKIAELVTQGEQYLEGWTRADNEVLYWKEQCAEVKRRAAIADRWYRNDQKHTAAALSHAAAERENLQKKLSQLQRQYTQQRKRAVRLAMRLSRRRAIRTYDRLTYRWPLHEYLEAGHTMHEQYRALKASINYDLLYGPKGKLP